MNCFLRLQNCEAPSQISINTLADIGYKDKRDGFLAFVSLDRYHVFDEG
jgi:hypothetical protein